MSRENDPTRRDFVKAAGAFSVPAIQKVSAATDQVGYGLIGAGARGSYLLRHMTALGNARCVAVCDIYEPSLESGAKTAGTNPRQYKTHQELLADKNVEAVVITTPLFAHFPVTRDALLAGKHVFCEKSVVFKPEEIHALRALANERSKQILQVGLQRRYSKFYQAAKQMVAKGLLGSVTHMQAQWHRNSFTNDTWNKPIQKGRTDRDTNWRKYRDLSGGLTAELASHQVDIAGWMFGAAPEFVVGVGGLNYIHDGRDIFDNIQLIFQYPKGQKCMYSAITTNKHLALFGGVRTEFGECILGTEGTIEITVGSDDPPAIGLWYFEPKPAKPTPASQTQKEETIAGASMASTGRGGRGFPILLDRDQMRGNESFLEREMKFARRWLYSKGVMLPEEDRNPVDVEMESFFDACRTGRRPLSDLEVGLADSTMVALSNLAMEEGRRVNFTEIDKMGGGPLKNSGQGPQIHVPA